MHLGILRSILVVLATLFTLRPLESMAQCTTCTCEYYKTFNEEPSSTTFTDKPVIYAYSPNYARQLPSTPLSAEDTQALEQRCGIDAEEKCKSFNGDGEPCNPGCARALGACTMALRCRLSKVKTYSGLGDEQVETTWTVKKEVWAREANCVRRKETPAPSARSVYNQDPYNQAQY